jgi:hypothetical protein
MRRRDLLATIGVAMITRFASAARQAHVGFIIGGDEQGAEGFENP